MDSSSVDEQSITSELPSELLIYILKLTCLLSHDAALRISLVSSWARDIAGCYVFGTVVRKAGSLYPIQGSVELSHKVAPPGCGKFVRHLWLETVDVLSSPREISLFKSCQNVEDIALSANSLRTLFAFHANPYTNPGTPAIHSLTLINPTPRTLWLVRPGALLSGITHLRMVDLQQSPYIPLEHLPNLTHLALPFMHLRSTHGDSPLPDNVHHCRRLQMVVLTVDHYDWIYRPWLHKGRYTASALAKAKSPRDRFRLICEAARKDTRVQVILSPAMEQDGGYLTVCAEWAATARGGESIWVKAARMSQDNSDDMGRLPVTYPKPHMQENVGLPTRAY